MATQLTQDGRAGKLTTVLGPDELVLSEFHGGDYVNRLFEYRVAALSSSNDVDLEALIGTHATVEMAAQFGDHVFDGIVTQARWAGEVSDSQKYELTLRPWLWVAGRRRNQRIFHEKSVKEILQELFEAYSGMGSPHLSMRLVQNYPILEYTVQYRESDMAFACRLMERFGINFHFTHDIDSHTLVLTDSVEDHDDVPGEQRPFHAGENSTATADEHFWQWTPERNLTTGAMRLTDFNFKTPTASMEVDRVGDAGYEQGQIEAYDYPGDYLAGGDGRTVVATRLEQERGQDVRHYAAGNCMGLGGGMIVELSGDEINGCTGETYICLEAIHAFSAGDYASGAEAESHYTGHYTLAPTSVALRPVRKTPVPVIHGPQTAMVVGEGEIDCDEFGRILVQFHWDLPGDISMRCRVSQNWASKGWGGMVIPRIGMEVVVEFLEGDPDKPLVTGCVYNGRNTVPYDLPANKTVSTFKSDTHGGEGFNEIRFEDESGREEIYVHGQKDRNEDILNDHSEAIGHDWFQTVGNDKQIEVTANHDELIGGNMTITVGPTGLGKLIGEGMSGLQKSLDSAVMALGIPELSGGDFMLIAEKSKTELIGISADQKIGIEKSVTVGVKSETTIGSESSYTVGTKIEVESGTSIAVKSGQTIEVESGKKIQVVAGELFNMSAGKNMGLTAGENTAVNVGKKMTVDVGDELTIVCGKASIKLKKDGTIELKGKDLKLDGSGKIDVKASKNVTMKGSKILQN